MKTTKDIGALTKSALLMVCLIAATTLYSCKGGNEESSNGQQTIVQQKATDSLKIYSDTLQSQLNAYRYQVDQLNTERAGLDSLLKNKDAELQKLRAQMGHYRKNSRRLAAKLKKAEAEIRKLKEMSGYDKDHIGTLQNENGSLTQQKDSVTRAYFSLKELASVLHASNIRMEAIHTKHHGKKEKDTKRARKTDILRVYFDIDENRIAESGEKNLYLVITGPDGQILPSATQQTLTASDGRSINYSILKQVALTKGEPVKDIHADWHQTSKYAKGTYQIAIYNGGYVIGSGRVSLK